MILAILQARMSSRRFPGKVLKPILGEPMLIRQIERIKRSQRIEQVLVATSTESSDDLIEQCCQQHHVTIFRGSLDDVLDRYYQASCLHAADHIVRLTADCPLTDPNLIDQIIRKHCDEKNDYTSNVIGPTFPDGLDVEVLTAACLRNVWLNAREKSQREHVTSFIREHPNQFRIGNYKSECDCSELRWTVDEAADFEFVSKIYSLLYARNSNFKTEDIMRCLKINPNLSTINSYLSVNTNE